MLRLLLLAAAAALIAVSLRKNAPEFALLATLAAGVLIISQLIAPVGEIVALIRGLTAGLALEAVTTPVLKIAGISALARITGEFCRDCGESALAAKAELTGLIGCLTAALPLVNYTLDIINGLI